MRASQKGSIRSRIALVLEQNPPLYPVEIARMVGAKRVTVRDTLGAMYRQGRVAKAARCHGEEAIWTSIDQVHRLPPDNVHTALVMPPEKPEPIERTREPVHIDPYKLAPMSSIWRYAAALR